MPFDSVKNLKESILHKKLTTFSKKLHLRYLDRLYMCLFNTVLSGNVKMCRLCNNVLPEIRAQLWLVKS